MKFTRVPFLSLIVCLLMVNIPIVSGQVQEIFVSPIGCDRNKGTEAEPLKSLERAQLLAKSSASSNVVIYLRAGAHRIKAPLNHVSSDWDISSKTLTYSNYMNEEATVKSSILLENLKWKKHKGKILKARVADNIKIECLYVNGEKQHVTRYPNFDSTIRHFNGFSADATSPKRVKRWKNPQGGIIHAMHSAEWGGYQYLIKGKLSNGELDLEGGFQNNRPMGMHVKYRMVENIYEELDAENEWYYDSKKQLLYFIPPAGLDLNNATIEVPQFESLFKLVGTEDNPISNISIVGLNLEHTNPSFLKTKEPLLRSDWMVYRGGAIYLEGAEDCLVDKCTISEIGGNAIMVSGYARGVSITRNHIYNIGASGISFIGSPNAVRSPSFQYAEHVPFEALDLEVGPKTNEYPAYCYAENNLIHDVGCLEKQVAGVQISMASNINIIHNSIYNLPRAGINISEGTWGGHLIDGNDVFNTVLETGDHGSFNSWGRDRFWIANRSEMDKLVSEHPELILRDVVETITIRNNRWQCHHGWDIDLDDGSSNYHIYNNLCLNGGIKLREGFNRTVENNILVNNSFHPHVWFNNSKDIFRHNIVMRNFFPIGIDSWGDVIDHNLFPDKNGLDKAQAEGTDKNSAYGKPMFIDPKEGDFSVSELSKALKVGFRNFDMTKFGVQYLPLKRMAQTPKFPKLVFVKSNNRQDAIERYKWKGANLKNLTTEGERSATGMPSVKGVLITSIENDSPLAKAGATVNSVIVEIEGKVVDNLKDLRTVVPKVTQQKNIQLVIFKNQAKEAIVLK